DRLRLFRRVAEVRAEKARAWAARDASLELIEDLLPARPGHAVLAQAVEAPARMRGELGIALVVGRRWSEERLRIAAVDQHRQAELARVIEDGIEARIVDREQRSVGELVAEAERLVDLEPDRALFATSIERVRRVGDEARVFDLTPVDVAVVEHAMADGVRC